MRRRQHGFTLFELMIGISIIGITAGLALPSFQTYSRNARATAAQNDLVAALHFARNEAIRSATPVSVCATSDFRTCAGGGSWSTGWIAFADARGSTGVVDAGDEVLRTWHGPGEGDVRVTSRDAGPTWIRFTATGLVTPPTGSGPEPLATSLIHNFYVGSESCAGAERPMRVIRVNGIGAIRSERIACT